MRNDRKWWLRCRLMVLGVLGMPGVAMVEEVPQTVNFRTEARVRLGADGVPVQVELNDSLPPAIARVVQARIGEWRFEMPQVEGRPVTGLTHVSVLACAVPDDSGRFGIRVRYLKHGPRRLAPASEPPIPMDAVHYGVKGSFVIHARIDPDGRAVVESTDAIDSRTPRVFDRIVRKWMAKEMYEPEEIDGRAAATRQVIPMVFTPIYVGRLPAAEVPKRSEVPWTWSPLQRDADGCELPDTARAIADGAVWSSFRLLGKPDQATD